MFLKPVNYTLDYPVLCEQVIARFHEFEGILLSNGIRLNPNGRFMSYKRKIGHYCAEGARKKRKDSRDIKLILQAVYEIEQIITITTALQKHPETNEWKNYLQRLLLDSDFPEKDKKGSPGRDLQFELFTAAICKQAGFPVRLAEPDIIVSHPDMDFCIAAKRIKSLNKVRRRISEAGKQIEPVMNGIICLDLTPIYNPSNAIMLTTRLDEAPIELQKFADGFIQQNSQNIRETIKQHKKVFGLMVFVSAACVSLLTKQSGVAMRTSATNLCHISDSRSEFMRTLVLELGEGEKRAQP